MRIKRSAQKARQLRDRNRRDRNRRSASPFGSGRKQLRCETLESRVLLDGSGLGPDGQILPPDPLPPIEAGVISGRVWADADGNRAYDGSEVGQGGVTVYSDFNFNGVLDANEPSTVTGVDDPVTDFDEGGLYTLDSLEPGWHNVRQVTPAGFAQTFPSLPDGYLPPPWSDASVHVTFVEQGQTVDDIDFGNQELQPGAVSGIKWEDVNGNGWRDDGETGLAGVTIYSDRNMNGVLDDDEPSTVTSEDDPTTDFDESGLYTLDGLEAGSHWIKEVVPEGYQQTFPNFWWFAAPADGVPPTDALFAPIPPFPGGGWHDVVIESGATVENIDFGNQQILPGSISGTKWEDLNGDGQRGSREQGLAGVTIYLDLNYNQQLDADEPSTVTSADDPTTDFDEAGLYTIEDVDPGFYQVREIVPDGYQQTFPQYGYIDPVPPLFDLGILPPADGAHYVSVQSGQAVEEINFGNQVIPTSTLSGTKWNDVNGNGEFDTFERGLPGVTIYLDLDDDGSFDRGEPSTVTSADVPETDFDESGQYSFEGLAAGSYVVREIVPNGFRQTFPLVDPLNPGTDGTATETEVDGSEVADMFATVDPERLDIALANGGVAIEEISITVHPNVFVPIDIDVVASPGDVTVINVSGSQVNGGGGDVSAFTLFIIAGGADYDGRLEFVDQAGGNVIASIPLTIDTGSVGNDGAHRVTLAPGQSVDGLNFGNQPLVNESGTVSGQKWEDTNGNAERDPNEPGIAGVTIYADLNFNGVLDADEPSTVTMEDIPETDFDEAGLYTLELDAGEYLIVEVVPAGYVQTYPNFPVIAIFPPPPSGHSVIVNPGGSVDGLDFGNRPVENGSVSGTKWHDLNGNGEREANEPGLAGVTIYADYNFNGQLDAGEPSTVTIEHPPSIAAPIDLTGFYSLETRPGFQAIREIVPDGFFQTFPVSDAASPLEQGAHFLNVESGVHVTDLNFGNQSLDNFPTGVSGRKWEDSNGNGVWDGDEVGLGGVTIYSDLNLNGVLDNNEPSTITEFDIPETDFDEGGLYSLGDLNAGFQVIREVVPDGFVQTFPISIAASPLELGGHFVTLAPGEFVADLDFGNQRLDFPLPGDFNADGTVDHVDLEVWEEGYGASAVASADAVATPMSGSDFLTWQRNLGRVAVAPPNTESGSGDASTEPANESPVGPLRASYRPTDRQQVDVVEAAFAAEAISVSAPALESSYVARAAGSSVTGGVRGAVPPRASYADLAAAIDAALEEEFWH